MDKNLDQLLKKLHIHPKNLRFYIEAFTHQTFSNENKCKANYQRLEFLGDAIISKLTTEFLYNHFSKASEGEMSIIRAKYINGKTLAKIANNLSIKSYILVGKSKDVLNSQKIAEDVFESLMGAIYLDLGEKQVKKILDKFIFSEIKKQNQKKLNVKNPKTELQEVLISTSHKKIIYKTNSIKNGFKSKIIHNDVFLGAGQGKTKKDAEANAANNALKKIGKNEAN